VGAGGTPATGGATGGGSAVGGSAVGGSAVGGAGNALCHAGDTRLCVGPAGCKGGQSCGTDEKSWSACDCGSGGSTAGGAAGNEPGSSMGGAAGYAEAGTAGEAGSGGARWSDEPCPPHNIIGPIYQDCSRQCGAVVQPDCDAACPVVLWFTTTEKGDTFLRLPSHPGDSSCPCASGAKPAAYSMGVRFSAPGPGSYHVSVPEPWRINPTELTGCSDALQLRCVSIDVSTAVLGLDFSVWTADPDAPAINLIVEGGLCP